MSAGNWYLYALTVAAIVVVPGPSTMLVSGRALDYGIRACLATIAGDLSANLIQMFVAATSTGVVYATTPLIVRLMKWAGVAYLFVIGWRMWSGGPAARSGDRISRPARERLFAEGFLVSAANPHALVFFLMVFPSFSNRQASLALQTMTMMVTFVTLDGAALLLYAMGAGKLGGGKQNRGTSAAVRRAGALVVMLSGALLAFKSTAV